MTIAITGLRASPWQSLASYIKQLERSCRRWQLYNCSNFLTRVTTLSTCTQGVDTGVESESPPLTFLILTQIRPAARGIY